MDHRLLKIYNDELVYLRESAREFGIEHAAVAGRLGLDAPGDPDPHVERLLEGVAFLSARVRLKLQDQFPAFTQQLLSALQPHYVSPTPAMCIAAFEPREDGAALGKGVEIARGTMADATADDDVGSHVAFVTAHPVTLWPIQIAEVEYLATRASLGAYGLAQPDAEAGLRIRFRATGGASLKALSPTMVPVYLDGVEALPGELYRQIIGDCLAVVSLPSGAAQPVATRLPLLEQIGFDDDEALLPADARSFRGYRLLAEYFTMPQRFHFVGLRGLDRAFAQCDDMCDVILLFRRTVPTIAGALTTDNFRLFSTPLINLFEKQIDRVPVSAFDQEWQVIGDRARPLDFEIFRLLDVTAHGGERGGGQTVAPLFGYAQLFYDWNQALFYDVRLKPRRLSTREQRSRRRTDYLGTESWISLTAPGDAVRLEDVRELAIRALVTNRELAYRLRLDGVTDLRLQNAPVRAIRLLHMPTRPRPPRGIGDAAWRVIAHLTPNYTSFVSECGSPDALRQHLALYAHVDEPGPRRQIDGLLSIKGEPVMRRAPGRVRTGFVTGEHLRIQLDDASFDNGRMFLFSAVLEQFLAEFATVNSFTEAAFDSVHEGRFVQWPARLSRRRPI